MKLGYLGPQGSYSHAAARAYDRGRELVPVISFYEIIQGVEEGTLDEGILPLENSTEGAVTPVMDGLLKTTTAQIINELVITVSHNLVSISKDLGEIDCVFSHQQAIEQCRGYLRTHLPQAKLLPAESTTAACLRAKEMGSAYGAITTKEAGEIYRLNVLAVNIQDNALNQTRFVIISKTPGQCCSPCKTSLAFSFFNDRPGALYQVLQVFAERKINLTRIESRPAKMEIGKYIFFIDLIGDPKDETIAAALDEIRKMTVFFKIFGTYPAVI